MCVCFVVSLRFLSLSGFLISVRDSWLWIFEMTDCDVATSVRSIITTLTSGLKFFHRRKYKGRAKHVSSSEDGRICKEDSVLRDSLQKRPLEIQAEYDQNVDKYGNSFRIGDRT